MITTVALVPQAPTLLPGLVGRGDPVAAVRSAVTGVVADLVETSPDEIVLVASGEDTTSLPVRDDLDLHRWGVGAGVAPRPARSGATGDPVPLPFAVGATLLRLAGWQGACRWEQIGWSDAGVAASEAGSRLATRQGRTGLLVLGRRLRAPYGQGAGPSRRPGRSVRRDAARRSRP